MSIKKNVLASSPDTISQRDEVRQIAMNFAKLAGAVAPNFEPILMFAFGSKANIGRRRFNVRF